MCGILISTSRQEFEKRKGFIRNRGGDSYLEVRSGCFYLGFSLLSIRGHFVQPFTVRNYLVLYNGEIYNGDVSDTLYVKKAVQKHSKKNLDILGIYIELNQTNAEMTLAISTEKEIYFYKDDVGKRSIGVCSDPFVLSSVLYDKNIDPLKIYKYDAVSKKTTWIYKPAVGILSHYWKHIEDILEFALSEKYKPLYGQMEEYRSLPIDGIHNLHDTVHPDNVDGRNNPGIICNEVFEILLDDMKNMNNENGNILFFSGGVDCTVVLLLLQKTLPMDVPIYLICTGLEGSQDLKVAYTSYLQFQKIFPKREIYFFRNIIDLEIIQKHKNTILKLIYPKYRKMDFNIGAVLYFSAMKSKEFGKICYLGSGADELFGGYSKYRTELKGCPDRKNMLWDIFTISEHNITRDDRVISNFGMEARFVFLAYRTIEASFAVPDPLVFSEDPEHMNKYLLRKILLDHGLDISGKYPKKAMQYGSGIKKVENLLWRD